MAFPGRPLSFTAPRPSPGRGAFPFFSGPLSAVGRAGAWWMRGSVLSGRGGL